MHILLLIIGIICWCLFFFYMAGLALFLLGVGMFLESGNWVWVIPAIIGAVIMSSSD